MSYQLFVNQSIRVRLLVGDNASRITSQQRSNNRIHIMLYHPDISTFGSARRAHCVRKELAANLDFVAVRAHCSLDGFNRAPRHG